jgi:hypothetical protein
MEAEKEERQRQAEEEEAKNNANYLAMKRMQERAAATRLEQYGSESDVSFEPKLEGLRDSMLTKIEEVDEDEISIAVEDEDEETEEVIEWSPFESGSVQNIENNVDESVPDLECIGDIVKSDYELDNMKLYQRPNEQNKVEKELVKELLYNCDEPESTLLLNSSSNKILECVDNDGCFDEFKKRLAWIEDKQQTMVNVDDEIEVKIIYCEPGEEVVVTGSFDNWNRTKKCDKVCLI